MNRAGALWFGAICCAVTTLALSGCAFPGEQPPIPAAVPVAAPAALPPAPAAAPTAPAPAAFPPQGAVREERRVEARKATDGDTIRLVDDRVVRYIGVDTPERGQPLYAQAARRNLELILGQTLVLEKEHTETDRYGRLLRHVWLERQGGERTLVGEVLVREGLAKATPYNPDTARSAQLRAAEAEAQVARRGLWQDFKTEAFYLASSDKFHRPGCSNATNIGRPTRFSTRSEAVQAGHRPARCCNP